MKQHLGLIAKKNAIKEILKRRSLITLTFLCLSGEKIHSDSTFFPDDMDDTDEVADYTTSENAEAIKEWAELSPPKKKTAEVIPLKKENQVSVVESAAPTPKKAEIEKPKPAVVAIKPSETPKSSSETTLVSEKYQPSSASTSVAVPTPAPTPIVKAAPAPTTAAPTTIVKATPNPTATAPTTIARATPKPTTAAPTTIAKATPKPTATAPTTIAKVTPTAAAATPPSQEPQPLQLTTVEPRSKVIPVKDQATEQSAAPKTVLSYSDVANNRPPLGILERGQEVHNQKWYIYSSAIRGLKSPSDKLQVVTMEGSPPNRGEEIRDLLVEMGIEPEKIQLILGTGEENQKGATYIFAGK